MKNQKFPMQRPPSDSHPERISAWFTLIARIAGVVLTIAGTVVLILLLFEVWNLYQKPSGIVSLAEAIEQATRIDAMLLGEAVGQSADTHTVSYFLAWILAIALLSLVGKVAYLSIRAGGGLLSPTKITARSSVSSDDETSSSNQLPSDYRPSHRVGGSGAPVGNPKQTRTQIR